LLWSLVLALVSVSPSSTCFAASPPKGDSGELRAAPAGDHVAMRVAPAEDLETRRPAADRGAGTEVPVAHCGVSACAPPPGVTCDTADFNGAGCLGAADLSLLINAFVNGGPLVPFDLNGSGAIGAADVALWICMFTTCF
jgi:hypothetical protein